MNKFRFLLLSKRLTGSSLFTYPLSLRYQTLMLIMLTMMMNRQLTATILYVFQDISHISIILQLNTFGEI